MGLRAVASCELGTLIDGISPTALPLDGKSIDKWNSDSLASALARLGYPGFRHLRGGRKHPASVLLAAAANSNVEVHVIEALPWLVAEHSGLDWEWVMRSQVGPSLSRLVGVRSLRSRLAARVRRVSGSAQRVRKTVVRRDTRAARARQTAE